MSFLDFFRPWPSISSSQKSGRSPQARKAKSSATRAGQANSKNTILQFEGCEVHVIRRPRRRSISIQMMPGQPIKVRAAMGVHDTLVLRLLEKKRSWIRKNLQQLRHPHWTDALRDTVAPREAASVEEWPYLGQKLLVKHEISLAARPFVLLRESQLIFYWPEKDYPLRAQLVHVQHQKIRAFLRKEAERVVRERVQIWSMTMGLTHGRIHLMQAQTRWGSCSSKKNLNFSWILIGAPLWVLDSVVIHELAHLKHMNHSREFWALVTQYCPNHKEADLWLKR